MLIDQSIARVRAYKSQMGWTVFRLAKAAGLNESTLRSIDSPDWAPTATTLRRLEAVIPNDFFPDLPVKRKRSAA